jgi:hypothetical protein
MGADLPDHLERMLTRLKLTAIRDQLDSLLDEAGRRELTIREALTLLCEREIARKGGNDRIKRALMLAADTARKVDPDLAEVYWRLMTTKGHHHKQALCAVANRLANRILSVMRSGRPHVLRDREGGEITIAQAKALIAARFTVPDTIRASRRANRIAIAG